MLIEAVDIFIPFHFYNREYLVILHN